MFFLPILVETLGKWIYTCIFLPFPCQPVCICCLFTQQYVTLLLYLLAKTMLVGKLYVSLKTVIWIIMYVLCLQEELSQKVWYIALERFCLIFWVESTFLLVMYGLVYYLVKIVSCLSTAWSSPGDEFSWSIGWLTH